MTDWPRLFRLGTKRVGTVRTKISDKTKHLLQRKKPYYWIQAVGGNIKSLQPNLSCSKCVLNEVC